MAVIVGRQACPIRPQTPAFDAIRELCVVILSRYPSILDLELIDDDI